MRDRFFSNAALILGLLTIPSGIFWLYKSWPPNEMNWYFFEANALMAYVFLTFGWGMRKRGVSSGNVAKPEVNDARDF